MTHLAAKKGAVSFNKDEIARVILFYESLVLLRELNNVPWDAAKEKRKRAARAKRTKSREKRRTIYIPTKDTEIRIFIRQSVCLPPCTQPPRCAAVRCDATALQPQKLPRIFIRVLWFKSHTPQYSPVVCQGVGGGAIESAADFMLYFYGSTCGSACVPLRGIFAASTAIRSG